MACLVFLDRQHSGKPHATRDRGAFGDLDGDGKHDVEESEAFLTAQYLWAAERKLIELGHAVLPISDGAYSARHARANQYAAQSAADQFVYVAAHVNAGGGEYGAVFYDVRSAQGLLLANAVAERLKPFAELPVVKVLAASATAHEAAYGTIKGIFTGRAVGICFEPCFIDTPKHRLLLTSEGLARIGEVLALGIDDYVRVA